MIAQRNTKRQSFFNKTLYGYSVLMEEDGLGWGYHAQPTAYNSDAMDEGWTLITDGLRKDEADKMREDLRDMEYALETAVAL